MTHVASESRADANFMMADTGKLERVVGMATVHHDQLNERYRSKSRDWFKSWRLLLCLWKIIIAFVPTRKQVLPEDDLLLSNCVPFLEFKLLDHCFGLVLIIN